MAGRVRFELTIRLHVYWISSPAHSTTLPPARTAYFYELKVRLAFYQSLGKKDQSFVDMPVHDARAKRYTKGLINKAYPHFLEK